MDIRKKLQKYLDDNLEVKKARRFGVFSKAKESSVAREEAIMDYECCECAAMGASCAPSINDYLNKEINDNKFQKMLFSFIDSKGLKDSDVYNKANIDRRLFSKIRSDENYHPSKETVISLATSLELSIDELESLLDSASYSLPKNNKFDLIIRFCFLEKIYNILEINSLLHEHNCNLLN